MLKTGSSLLVYALEQIGVTKTFGIPGVHNTEIYDELHQSKQIEPILVTHEAGAAFMADGISRTTGSIGTLVTVPAAGTTHAMSGIGEAYLDGIPMLIISGGTRRDTGKHFQLHQMDQEVLTKGVVKAYFLIKKHDDIIDTIYRAYNIAISGEPGPVFVEIPLEIQMFRGEVGGIPDYSSPEDTFLLDTQAVEQAVSLLKKANNPGIYVGWGAVDATDEVVKLAELLNSPVSTTLQGLSAFPGNHPLHTGVGFGASGLPAAQTTFKNCDCLLAVGVRFGELATGSFGISVPENLIHIDINPAVFNKNYPAKISIEGDAKNALRAILDSFDNSFVNNTNYADLKSTIKTEKEKYLGSWMIRKKDEIVSPGYFFTALRNILPEDSFVITDDGKHTFLTAELFETRLPRHFISPTDFNCMGYCVPASIGVGLGNPGKTIISIVGDGSFMMTCMELVTATSQEIGLVVFVFNDGELGQISQFQKIPLNRKTCSLIGKVNFEGVALATGAHYLNLNNDHEIETVIDKALNLSGGKEPVIVDVNIDYTQKTRLTKGVVKTNLGRFPFKEKVRFLTRALKRHVLG
jgi:acetolactate synthase-1/2/3 large subunit